MVAVKYKASLLALMYSWMSHWKEPLKSSALKEKFFIKSLSEEIVSWCGNYSKKLLAEQIYFKFDKWILDIFYIHLLCSLINLNLEVINLNKEDNKSQ